LADARKALAKVLAVLRAFQWSGLLKIFTVESTNAIRNRNPGMLQGLQVLRGVAASLVVWCHLKYAIGMDPDSIANHPWLATDIGAIGVDIFFVISG
jgi:hypothetical protein